ncbi:MAG: family 43 glycosylhydrolase [Gemmatimonadetes bacterium]|nr:family 43 glycosylhydrolase [Gemmatimonadota bacterium]
MLRAYDPARYELHQGDYREDGRVYDHVHSTGMISHVGPPGRDSGLVSYVDRTRVWGYRPGIMRPARTMFGLAACLAACAPPVSSTPDAAAPPAAPPTPSAVAPGDTLSGNPIVLDMFTADPAALVHDGRLYIFTGRDEASPAQADFVMREWHAFSSAAPDSDPAVWEHHGALLSLDDFAWADANAWASEVVRGPEGRFYWFVSTRWADAPREGDPMSIGVAVADHPLGPYRDAIGGPLITQRLENASDHNIDPTVLVADDGIHMYWGSFWSPRYVRVGDSMIELAGEVRTPEGLEGFWEAPWLFGRDGVYYMLYASNRNIDDDGCVTSRYYACIRYATAEHPAGPWRHRGIVLGQVSSTTNHPAAIEFPAGSDHWWMVYHTADLPGGGNFRRSVAIDPLVFEADGSMRKVTQTRHDPPDRVPVPTDDASLSATVTCSYTSPWERCEALSSGPEPASSDMPGPNLGTRWGTWPETGPQWIEYAWDHPVRLHSSEIYWFQDTPDTEEGGVKRPASWSIHYWNGEGWAPVPGADPAYGVALDRYNRTAFDPVTTSRIRALVQPRADAEGVGALRWKVFSPHPYSIEEVAVTTEVGAPPTLPPLVALRYADGTILEAPVSWLAFDVSLLRRPGTFTVPGVVANSPIEAQAIVNVRTRRD